MPPELFPFIPRLYFCYIYFFSWTSRCSHCLFIWSKEYLVFFLPILKCLEYFLNPLWLANISIVPQNVCPKTRVALKVERFTLCSTNPYKETKLRGRNSSSNIQCVIIFNRFRLRHQIWRKKTETLLLETWFLKCNSRTQRRSIVQFVFFSSDD